MPAESAAPAAVAALATPTLWAPLDRSPLRATPFSSSTVGGGGTIALDTDADLVPAPLPLEPDLPADIPTLQARYGSTQTSAEERKAIVRVLGLLESPLAVPALGWIFDREKRLETRMLVLETLGDLTSVETQGARVEILLRATAATQSLTVRLSALQSLAELPDKRVPPILQTLSHDSNTIVRDTARQLLRDQISGAPEQL